MLCHFSITLIVTQYYYYVYIIIYVYYRSVYEIGNLCLILLNIFIKHVKQFHLRGNIDVNIVIFQTLFTMRSSLRHANMYMFELSSRQGILCNYVQF